MVWSALRLSSDKKKTEFAASTRWLTKFLKRHTLHNIKMNSEISSADDKNVAEEFLPKLTEIIEGSG